MKLKGKLAFAFVLAMLGEVALSIRTHLTLQRNIVVAETEKREAEDSFAGRKACILGDNSDRRPQRQPGRSSAGIDEHF